MAIDEVNSFASECVGQVLGFDERRLISQDVRIVVVGNPCQETEELIETPLYRVHIQRLAQMPFTDRPADIARRLEELR